jgi:hypothetical protein
MATSYKQLWQEAQQEIEQLRQLAGVPGVQIVDLAGIARHMHVERFTPQQWQQRDLLPPVDFPEIKGVPLWWVSTIKTKFVQPTGRLWCDHPTAQQAAECETPHFR